MQTGELDAAQVGFSVEEPMTDADLAAQAAIEEQYALGNESMFLDPWALMETEGDGDITQPLSGTYERSIVGGDHSGAMPDEYHPPEVHVQARVREMPPP